MRRHCHVILHLLSIPLITKQTKKLISIYSDSLIFYHVKEESDSKTGDVFGPKIPELRITTSKVQPSSLDVIFESNLIAAERYISIPGFLLLPSG